MFELEDGTPVEISEGPLHDAFCADENTLTYRGIRVYDDMYDLIEGSVQFDSIFEIQYFGYLKSMDLFVIGFDVDGPPMRSVAMSVAMQCSVNVGGDVQVREMNTCRGHGFYDALYDTLHDELGSDLIDIHLD